MRNCKCFITQYPHGFNDGFEYHDGKAPPITISSWQANNFVIFYEDMQNFEIIPILRIKEATKAGFMEIHPGASASTRKTQTPKLEEDAK